MENWYSIELPYATFAISEIGGIIKTTAPIGRWMREKSLFYINEWVRSKKGKITKLKREGTE